MESLASSQGLMSEKRRAGAPAPLPDAPGVSDADVPWLRVALPPQVSRLAGAGRVPEAIEACGRALDRAPAPELAARIRLEWHRLSLAATAYCVPLGRVLEELRAEVPGTTPEDVRELVGRGLIDARFIEGELRALPSYIDTLRLYPEALPGLSPSVDEGAPRRAVAEEMERCGGASRIITVRASLAVEGAGEGDDVAIWLPVAADAPQQGAGEVLSSSPGGALSAPGAPARTMSWRCKGPAERFVEYRYRIDAPYLDLWSPAGVAACRGRVQAAPPCPADLAEVEPHLVATPLVSAVARSIAASVPDGGALELARAAYLYVTGHVDYRYQPAYIHLDCIPDYVLSSGFGDCGAMTLTFIALLRALGVPARWQSGLFASPGDIGPHDWAMFHTPEAGWAWADCSFGCDARRSGDERLRRFYFGSLDPWRTVCCQGFLAPFEPRNEGLRRDPFDNQMGEAERCGRGLDASSVRQSVELVDMRGLPWGAGGPRRTPAPAPAEEEE